MVGATEPACAASDSRPGDTLPALPHDANTRATASSPTPAPTAVAGLEIVGERWVPVARALRAAGCAH